MRVQPHGFHRSGCVLTLWGGFLTACKAKMEAGDGTVWSCYCKVEQEAGEVQFYGRAVITGMFHGLRVLFIKMG